MNDASRPEDSRGLRLTPWEAPRDRTGGTAWVNDFRDASHFGGV